MQGIHDLFYNPAVPVVFPILLFPLPWFHYGRVFQDILEVTHPSGSGTATDVQFFSLSDLSRRLPQQSTVVDGRVTLWSPPPPGMSLGMLVACSVFYLVLAWYLGQVASGDLGASQPFYFPLSPTYWGFKLTSKVP